MTEKNETFAEYIKGLSYPHRIILACLLPAGIVHKIITYLLPKEKKGIWKKYAFEISLGITVVAVMIICFFAGVNVGKNSSKPIEDTGNIIDWSEWEDYEWKEKEDEEEDEAKEEVRKAEEEEKARLAEEEKAKKAAEEAEKQRQEEAALQEKKARASAAFANPLGHKGEIIAVTGTITVDYAYRKNDTKKYTTKLPAGTKDGWGGFWIDTQYGKCYAEYSGYGPKKDYNSGDTVTFVGRVVSDESTFEPMNGIVAPLWIDATEDF